MAISVELTDFERVAGFVNPGNEVAVFATALDPVALLPDDKEQKLGSVTRIVLTRVPVLGVGTTSVTSRTVQGEEGASHRGGRRARSSPSPSPRRRRSS